MQYLKILKMIAIVQSVWTMDPDGLKDLLSSSTKFQRLSGNPQKMLEILRGTPDLFTQGLKYAVKYVLVH
jgi:hypothetical protein